VGRRRKGLAPRELDIRPVRLPPARTFWRSSTRSVELWSELLADVSNPSSQALNLR